MYAALRPRQPAVARACRYPAYTTQVMNAHVSLGSQPQYRPQAWSAQIAPAMTANVQIGNAKITVRYESRSRASAGGSRCSTAPNPVAGAAWWRRAYRSAIRYRTVRTAATI